MGELSQVNALLFFRLALMRSLDPERAWLV